MNGITDLEKTYCPQYTFVSLDVLLDELEQTYGNNNQSKPITKPKTKRLKVEFVTPDRKYVSGLAKTVGLLMKNIADIKHELGKAQDGLEKILSSGDFDDPEEIMNNVHEIIRKYIYGSDSKLNNSDWEKLERFLLQAGYKPVVVNVGDSIIPFRTYFDQPIAADGGQHDVIKSIQLKPFEIRYSDGEELITLKLCGKCTYYR